MSDFKQNIQLIYNALRREGYTDIGSVDDFSKSMQDEGNRKKVYNALHSGGYTDIGKDFNTFSGMIYEAPRPVQQPAQQQAAAKADPYHVNAIVKTEVAAQQPKRQQQPKAQQQSAPQSTIKLPSFEDMAEQSAWKPTPIFETETSIDKEGNRVSTAKPMPVFKNGKVVNVYTDMLTGKEYEDGAGPEQDAKDFERGMKAANRKMAYDNVDTIDPQQQNRLQVDGMLANIDDLLSKAYKTAQEKHADAKPSFWQEMLHDMADASHGAGPIHTDNAYETLVKNDTDVRALSAAKNSLKDAQALIAEADKSVKEGNFDGFFKGAGRGFGNKLFDARTWDMGLADAQDAGATLTALADFDAGKKLTPAQQTLLDAKAVELATNAYFGSYIGRGYKAGGVTAESIPFMIEMCINPASGAGHGAQSMLTRYALKRFGKQVVKNNAKKYIAAKVATRVLGDVAGSATMAATTGSIHTLADAEQRMAGDVQFDTNDEGYSVFAGHTKGDDAGTAFAKAFANTTIENYSEMFGEYFAPVLKPVTSKVGGAMARGMEKVGLGSVNDFISHVGASDVAKIVTDFEKHAKWNGVFGEYAEEVAGNIMNAAIVGDMTMDNAEGTGVFNLDQNIDTFLGVSLMGGFMSGVKATGYRTPKYRQKQAMTAADDAASTTFGNQDTWGSIRNTVAFGNDQERHDKLVEVLTSDEYTQEQKQAAMQYAKEVEAYKGMQQAEQKRRSDENSNPLQTDAETSFDNGYSLASAQEMNDAKNMLDYRSQKMQDEFGISEGDIATILGDDPVAAIDAMRETYSPEQIKAATDYLNAKATWDGMIAHVQDDIADKTSKANAEIDARVNKTTGMVQPATMKYKDRKVYIVGGNVAMMDDGSMVDEANSDESVIIRDAETGKIEMVSPADIFKVEQAIDPVEEKERAQQEIRESVAQEAANNIDGTLAFGENDTYTILDDDGQQHNATIVQATDENGQPIELPQGQVAVSIDGAEPTIMPADAIQQGADRYNLARLQRHEQQQVEAEAAIAEQEHEATRPVYELNDEVTLRDENGLPVRGSITAAENEDGLIEVWTESPIGGNKVNMFTRDQLDGMLMQQNGVEVEQPVDTETTAEGAQSVSELQENGNIAAQNIPENGNIEAENIPQRAIDRIPTVQGEDGKTVRQWEQAEPADTFDALNETYGDEQRTTKKVGKRIDNLDKQIKAVQKQIDKLDDSDDFDADINNEDGYQKLAQQKAALEAQKKYWQSVQRIPQDRRNEANRLSEEERKKAQEEREAAEAAAAEQARIDRERTNGVPDMVSDKPADARARGFRNVNGQVIERQQQTDGVVGRESNVKFSNNDTVKGRIKVIEASQLQPSHVNGVVNAQHFIPEAQPKNRTDQVSDVRAGEIAANINPEEITGDGSAYQFSAPATNTRGEVIQGNNRGDALRRMWADVANEQSQQAYKQYLIDHADEFGLDAQAIAAMQQPVMVNELDVDDNEAIRLGQLKSSNNESGGIERIDPVTTARTLGSKMSNYANVLLGSTDEEASLSELIADNSGKAISWLSSNGFITPTQVGSAYDAKGSLTEEAKLDLKNILKQSLFQGGVSDLPAMFDAMPAKAQKAILTTFMRDFDSTEDNRILGDIQQAIEVWYHAAHSTPEFAAAKNYEQARAQIEGYKRQMNLLDDNMPIDLYSPFAFELAVRMHALNMKTLQQYFNDFFDLVQGKSMGGLFNEGAAGEFVPMVEAIKRVFNVDFTTNNTDNNDQERSTNVGDNATQGADGRQGEQEDAQSGEQNAPVEEPAETGAGNEGDTGEAPDIPSAGGDGVRQAHEEVGLSDDEATAFLSKMEDAAEEMPQLELTPENWHEQFGEDGVLTTPIGQVKMGANQIAKLFEKGRSNQFGMIKPTLENPNVIIEVPSSSIDGTEERYSSYLFVKTFTGSDGSKIYYFKSVTVKKDGMEVSVSSHYDRPKRILDALKKGKLLYRFDGGAQTEHRPADVSVTTSPVVQGKQRSTTFTDANRENTTPISDLNETSSEDKGSKSSSKPKEKNEKGAETHEEKQPAEDNHRLVSTERYEELKKRLRAKLGQLNMGIDPEIIAIGSEMAVYHIEGGARKFIDYAKAMIADVGDVVRPYLKSFYNAVRDMPEAEQYADEMTPYDEVRQFNVATIGENGEENQPTVIETAEQVSNEQTVQRNADEVEVVVSETENTTENTAYSITPAEYKTKRGKGLDMFLVKPNDELGKSEQREANARVREMKGWWDKNAGGFMLRSEEDARQFAEQTFSNPIGTTSSADEVQAAREATNTNPTEAQKEAGNYAKGHIKVDGYDIVLENPKGSTRSGKDANGKEWSITMDYDYGYISRTEGVDGDHIDVYLSDNPASGNVYVVDQINQSDGSFDEHKVMYGFPSMEAAREAYASQYEDGWKIGPITEVSREEFKKWVYSSKRKTKPFVEYKNVKKTAGQNEQANEPIVDARDPKTWVGWKFFTNGMILKCTSADSNYAQFDNLTTYMSMGFDVPTFQKMLDRGEVAPVKDKRDEQPANEPKQEQTANTSLMSDTGSSRDEQEVNVAEGKTFKSNKGLILYVDRIDNGRVFYEITDIDGTTERYDTSIPAMADALQRWEEVTTTNNNNNNEADRTAAEQAEANTEAVASEAETVASEAESTAEAATTEREVNEAEQAINDKLEEVESQLALLGYYEGEEVAKDYNEAYGYLRNAAKKTGKKLGTKVRIVENVEELTDKDARKQKRMRRAKGWYDTATGEVVVVVPNADNVGDVVATVLHEVVGHEGLRKVVGEQHFDNFLRKVYERSSRDTRAAINALAAKNGWNFALATEEYIAEMAESGFNNRENLGTWERIKQFFKDMLSAAKIAVGIDINDNDLRYMLWRSYQMQRSRGAMGVAEDIAMQQQLGVGNYADTNRYRNGGSLPTDDVTDVVKGLRQEYDEAMKKSGFQVQEAIQDSMLSLKKLMEIMQKHSGKKEVADWENAYTAENALSSRNKAEQDEFKRKHYNPLMEAMRALKGDMTEEEIGDYVMAKHGIERNREMAVRAVIAEEQDEAQRKLLEQAWNDEKELVRGDNITWPTWREKQEALDNFAMNDMGADIYARDYSGLTSLYQLDDVEQAVQTAYSVVEDAEQRNPAETEALHRAIKVANAATLEKLFTSGMISRATKESIEQMYDYYVPLRGFDETTAEEVYAYVRDERRSFNNPLKRAKGRSSKADNPFAHILSLADSAILQGNKNLMKQKFLNFVLNRPSDLVSVSDMWIKKDPVTDEWVTAFPTIPDDATPEEVADIVRQFNEDMQTEVDNGNPDIKRIKGKTADVPYRTLHDQINSHQVIVKRDGKEYVMTINANPRAAMALNGQTNPHSDYKGVGGAFKRSADYVNRQLAGWYTTKNPDFVASNFVRDALYSNSMVWVKESPRYAVRFHKNFVKFNPKKMGQLFHKYNHGTLDMSDPVEKEFYRFMMNGGETGYSNLKEIDELKKELTKDLKNTKLHQMKALLDRFEIVNRSVENCARFAAYMSSREEGRSVQRSVYDAKEISVNFNKKGAGGTFFGAVGQTKLGSMAAGSSAACRALYVFFNAGVQGTTNILRAAKHNKKKFGALAASYFILGYLAPMLMGGGDDDDEFTNYDDLPDYVRRTNLIIPIGSSYISLPLPIEFRTMYGMGELASNVLSGKERYTGTQLARTMAEQVTQALPINFLDGEGTGVLSPFVPSAVAPLYQAHENMDWTGMPIYKDNDYNKKKPEYTKAFGRTNRHLVNLAEGLNNATGGDEFSKGAIDLNPALVEHIVQGYFGGAVTFLNKMSNSIDMATGEMDPDWRNVPIANRLVKSGSEYTKQRAINREYFSNLDQWEEIQQRERGYIGKLQSPQISLEEKAEWATKLDDLHKSEEWQNMQVFNFLNKQVKKMGEIQKAMPQENPELARDIWNMKRQANEVARGEFDDESK